MRFLKYLWLLPIILFFVNQAVQISMVKNRGLSTWVGGGYGMFANLDKPLARLVQVEIMDEKGWGNYNVRDKSFKSELEAYKQHMNDELLRQTLKKISPHSRAHIYVPFAHDSLKLKHLRTVYVE